MRTPSAARQHVRSNLVGYLALFCFVIGGTAQALPGKNKVDSGDIKNGQVKSQDLAAASVSSHQVADNALTGADIDESSLQGLGGGGGGGGAATGPAGGDLTGTYPNPQIAANAIGSAEIAADAVGSDEVAPDAIGSDEVASSAIGSTEVGFDALTGGNIDESTLTVGVERAENLPEGSTGETSGMGGLGTVTAACIDGTGTEVGLTLTFTAQEPSTFVVGQGRGADGTDTVQGAGLAPGGTLVLTFPPSFNANVARTATFSVRLPDGRAAQADVFALTRQGGVDNCGVWSRTFG